MNWWWFIFVSGGSTVKIEWKQCLWHLSSVYTSESILQIPFPNQLNVLNTRVGSILSLVMLRERWSRSHNQFRRATKGGNPEPGLCHDDMFQIVEVFRYKIAADPTTEDVRKLCLSMRRNAKDERVLFHYNGHGVPRPTSNGEIWVFNKTYTQVRISCFMVELWFSIFHCPSMIYNRGWNIRPSTCGTVPRLRP